MRRPFAPSPLAPLVALLSLCSLTLGTVSTLPALATVLAALPSAVPADYFPNSPGRVWRYSNGEVQQTLAGRTVQGVRVVPLSHSVGKQLVSVDYLEYRGGGVLLRGVQAGAGGRLSWYPSPLVVYPPGPLLPGQSWSSASGGPNGLRLSGQVMGIQPLTTGAGNFNALVIRNEVLIGSDARKSSTQYAYFVPGLGVVRYQTADGSTIDLLK